MEKKHNPYPDFIALDFEAMYKTKKKHDNFQFLAKHTRISLERLIKLTI